MAVGRSRTAGRVSSLGGSVTTRMPRVSVVIPVYQGERWIAECLRSVLDQTFPSDLYEIVVVNNGSTDRTAAIAAGFPVHVVDEPRRGVGSARNAGVARSRGELVVFTDADCVADPKWLAALVARFDSEPGLGGVGGYLPGFDPQTPVQYYVAESDLLSQEVALEQRPFSAPYVVTANALLPRRLVEEAGGFDPLCKVSGEDADLCWRISDRGLPFAFAPDAVVYHRHRSTVGSLGRWMFRYGAGSVYLMKKHHRRYGIGRILVDGDHYSRWAAAVCRFLTPWPLGFARWERRFAGYDVLRFSCFTAGRMVGSIRYRAIIL